MTALNPLQQLGEKYEPSKRLHNYLEHYWMHFRDLRESVRNVLEIGVQSGTSLRMWQEFFPNATIWGIDIDPACEQVRDDRIRVMIGDQADGDFLEKVDRAAGPFDIIIDDGSHKPWHQLFTFGFFIKRMTDNGIYVIEDIGVGRGHDRSWTNNAMTDLVNHINYWDFDLRSEDWLKMKCFPDHASWLDRNIIGVAFYRFICFVMRGNNPGRNPFLS